jgi:hypothetical protein
VALLEALGALALVRLRRSRRFHTVCLIFATMQRGWQPPRRQAPLRRGHAVPEFVELARVEEGNGTDHHLVLHAEIPCVCIAVGGLPVPACHRSKLAWTSALFSAVSLGLDIVGLSEQGACATEEGASVNYHEFAPPVRGAWSGGRTGAPAAEAVRDRRYGAKTSRIAALPLGVTP